MACMTDAYLLQWIWVAIIVIVAVVFVVRTLRRLRNRIMHHKECDGCSFINECGVDKEDSRHPSVDCKHASRPRGCINKRG